MTALLPLAKLVHVAGVAIWMAGLMSVLALQIGAGRGRGARHRQQELVYLTLASPAGLVAILSGVVLIWLAETWQGWFVVKMAGVAAIAFVHLRLAALIEAPAPRLFRPMALGLVLAAGACTALAFVLAKPPVPLDRLGPLLAPGGLQGLAPDFLTLNPR